MRWTRVSVRAVAAVWVLGAALACAQDWKTMTALPGVDWSGLSEKQKALALKVLREHDCTCGCDMKMAECRVKDPNCSYSRGLAAAVVAAVKRGASEADAVAAAAASRYAHGPTRDTRVLGDPVTIRIDGAPVTGPKEAPVTLVEFSDFQCPYCAEAVSQLKAVLQAYPTQVRLVFKEYPLDRHSQAALAAAAALAAHKQGKFWPLHDAMFAERTRLSRKTILESARGLGLDMKRFEADLDSAAIRQAVARDVEDGDQAGVEATPTLFLNGRRYNGRIQLEALRPLIDAELKRPARSK